VVVVAVIKRRQRAGSRTARSASHPSTTAEVPVR
jgi:hypothetical protein